MRMGRFGAWFLAQPHYFNPFKALILLFTS
jgi:hypothetical protein